MGYTIDLASCSDRYRPLVLYYFSRFSTHFLLTNLLVIPLASVIMYLSIAFFLFIPLPFIQQWIVWLLKQALDFLNSSVRWVEHLPYSSLESVWVYTLEVPLIYLLLFFGVRFFYNKEAKTLICALTLLLSLCSYHFVMRLQDHPETVLHFTTYRVVPLHILSGPMVVHCLLMQILCQLTNECIKL